MIRILYLDDNPEILSFAKQYLKIQEDIVVDTVESARDGLSLLQKNPYDALITDYFMPDMDGVTLLKEVRSQNPSLPILIFSDQGDEATVSEALNNGANFYIKQSDEPKTQFSELVRIIRLLLSHIQSEELLRKSEEKFRTIADYSHEWMYWADTAGNLIYVSPSCEQITGYTPEEFYQDPFLSDKIVYEEDRTHWFEHQKDCSYQPGPLTLDLRIVHKNGEIRWISHICHAIHMAGESAGRLISNREVTSRKNTETLLLHERNNFLKIFRAAPVGLLLLNPDTEITQANEAISAMVLRDPVEIIRKRGGGGIGCIHSEEDPRGCGYSSSCPECPLRHGIEAVIREKISIQGEIIPITLMIEGSPHLRWLSINAEPVDIEGLSYVIVAIDDITEQREIEIALQESKNHYRSLFEHMLEGFAYCRMIYDEHNIPVDWIYLEVND